MGGRVTADERIAAGERYCGACLEWARDCRCAAPVHVAPTPEHRRRAAMELPSAQLILGVTAGLEEEEEAQR